MTTDDPNDQGQDSELVRRLRQEIKDRDTQLAEERQLRQKTERENVFRSLNVPIDEGPGKLLYDSLEGHDVTAEAVKEKMEAYGLSFEPDTGEEEEDPGASGQEQQEHGAMDDAAKAAGAAGDSSPTPQEQANAAAQQVFEETGDREKQMASWFAHKLDATVKERQGAR